MKQPNDIQIRQRAFRRMMRNNAKNIGINKEAKPSKNNVIYNNELVDFIVDADIKCANKIHVLIVNLNQLNYTQRLVNDLLVQDGLFDLTIFDQNSQEDGTDRYYNFLKTKWTLEGCNLNIIRNTVNAPLNHVWNWFYEHASNDFLAFLNNDMEICNNFIKDAISIFEKEDKCGMIVHPTNNEKYTKLDKLTYEITEEPFLQGWDFIMRRCLYESIPSEMKLYCGDDWLLNSVIRKGYYEFYDISSPIIHYLSKTISKNRKVINNILTKDLEVKKELINKGVLKDFYKDKNKYTNRQFRKEYCLETDKKIIVSLTTYPKRIQNIPVVLDSILKQSKTPNRIVLNLSIEEYPTIKKIPSQVYNYLKSHEDIIEINLVKGKNRKVYKKIIPTLLKYKNDLVISIDDDFIYPINMIQDFYETYKEHPFDPVSGNRVIVNNMKAHCGCSSLVQYKHLCIFINDVDEEIYSFCPASDLFYTYVVNYNGYSYHTTHNEYFHNMKKYNEGEGYSYTNKVSNNYKKNISFLENYFNRAGKKSPLPSGGGSSF